MRVRGGIRPDLTGADAYEEDLERAALVLANTCSKRQSARLAQVVGKPIPMTTKSRIVSMFVAGTLVLAANSATVPLFPSTSHPSGQGFVRIVNHSESGGQVTVTARDDAGMAYDPIALSIGANKTAHFNSEDLEAGNSAKGLPSGTGPGDGDWWLEVSSPLNIEVLAYMRTTDGFLTSMFETVPGIASRHRVPVFNPGSNREQISKLRIVNPGDESVEVQIVGVDDDGVTPQAAVTIPPGLALTATAQDLESGEPMGWPSGAQIAGSLGDGAGKWQLILTSSTPITVMSLLESPTGHLTNLSAAPALVWRGLAVVPESRCAGNRYDRDEYGTRYRSKEDDIIEDLGAIYGPYTGRCFESDSETTIEHIVAIHEAHTSGMCTRDTETKRTFAGDLLNLTLAAGDVNSAKSNLDAFDWLPEKNRCWFAQRVVDVKLKYGMTVDKDEAAALEAILSGCESTEIIKESCAQ